MPDALLAALPAKMAGAAQRVLPAIADAARRTGADFGALFKMARLESGFRADARAGSSSAAGLFQFIDSTWLQMLRKHGADSGLAGAGVPGGLSRAQALQLRNDPAIASLMAARHMADNAAALERTLGRSPDETDLYLAHFLGLGGAGKFLTGLAAAPDTSGASLFPAAAKANPGIFYAGGNPRSLGEIHQLLAARLNATPAPADTRPPPAGTRLPAAMQAQLAAAGAAAADAPGAAIAPAAAAQLAYLLLAELGG